MENYLKDIQDIRKMMDRSTQFLSLSGISGIMAGVYALAGAFAVKQLTHHNYRKITLESQEFRLSLVILAAVFVLSVGTAFILSSRKARKNGETLWNNTSKRLAANFMIPLCTGGLFALLLINSHHYGLIAPVTLIFYGLACVNASKYTLRDVRYLGITIIIIGLAATYAIGYGLEFWALGFGVCHILYGSIMYYRYDRK
ncbi:hypothetical protein AM493_08005 [Flavobacterium akiainvivens]|uniref:Uncharacterized protein n=1 Tax=Flavobacterium akiainvivens TaxID=1202724 RepID=A0A0M9VHV4_9FLAO|nr:hypothetical protein [Flavobacterium akiainvivens]KOS05986.1 hypothetical protein AM493_08005 [Flavobacterium akiainvivens]SFQ53929.1 hypothetical protein SAMN05444144_10782 [Flavobacterium akiainvivens]